MMSREELQERLTKVLGYKSLRQVAAEVGTNYQTIHNASKGRMPIKRTKVTGLIEEYLLNYKETRRRVWINHTHNCFVTTKPKEGAGDWTEYVEAYK